MGAAASNFIGEAVAMNAARLQEFEDTASPLIAVRFADRRLAVLDVSPIRTSIGSTNRPR